MTHAIKSHDKYTDAAYQRAVENFTRNHIYCCVSGLIGDLVQDDKYIDELLEFSLKYDQLPAENQYRYVVDMDERGEYLATVYKINDDTSETEAIKITGDMFADCGELEGADVADHEGNVDFLLKQAGLPLSSRVLDEDDDIEFETSEDPIEALEYWLVSDWLADELEEQGELVTHDFLGLTIWGRTTSGQAISMDRVICDIYDDLQERVKSY